MASVAMAIYIKTASNIYRKANTFRRGQKSHLKDDMNPKPWCHKFIRKC